VDPGYVKMKGYDPSRGVASLVVVPVSKVAAEQRAGRAGRTDAGQCYRLYSKACFEALAPETIPEIRRSSMATVALALKSLSVVDVLDFDFLDRPDETQLACALLELHALGALDPARGGALTATGRAMARLALEPPLARSLLAAVGFRGERDAPRAPDAPSRTTRDAVLSICAMLSAEDVWFVGGDPRDRRGGPSARRDAARDVKDESLDRHARFRHPRGDLISLLLVFTEFDRACATGRGAGFARAHSLRDRALQFARKARAQLDDELRRLEPEPTRAPASGAARRVDLDATCRALCAGLCLNAAERSMNGAYVLLPAAGAGYSPADAPKVALVRMDNTTTAAFSRDPETIVFHELRVGRSSKGAFAKNVVVVDRATLDAARSRVDTATAEALCGRPEPDDDDASAALAPRAPSAAPPRAREPARAPPADASAVDAARARFLSRKRGRP